MQTLCHVSQILQYVPLGFQTAPLKGSQKPPAIPAIEHPTTPLEASKTSTGLPT